MSEQDDQPKPSMALAWVPCLYEYGVARISQTATRLRQYDGSCCVCLGQAAAVGKWVHRGNEQMKATRGARFSRSHLLLHVVATRRVPERPQASSLCSSNRPSVAAEYDTERSVALDSTFFTLKS
jgi:hypothetical protein